MKIKMIRFYSGKPNGFEDWHKDQQKDVDAKLGKYLVDGGYAVEVKPPASKPTGKAATKEVKK